MPRWIRIVMLLLGLAVLALAGVVLALQYWVGSGDFRGRIEREASAALGLPVRLRAVSVAIWPLPSVALDGLAVASKPPLTVERIEARPVWAALLRGRLEVATLLVRQAVLPAPAVAAIAAAAGKRRPAGHAAALPPAGRDGWWPRRARFDELSWIDAGGRRTTVDAQVQLGDDGLPASATLKVLRGRLAGTAATLQRDGAAWRLQADIGGGRATARVALQRAARGAPTALQGNYQIANVDVASLAAPSRTLTGRLDASGSLRLPLQDLGRLREALHTQTQFTVRNAVVQGIDLRRAMQTVGLNRGGNTPLDLLAGRLASQGGALQLTQLVASAGNLSASGEVAMAADKTLAGSISVSLAGAATGNAISVPLQVGGTLDSPSLTLSRGALLGAAIGTVLLPGVGTGAGAQLGDRLGKGLGGLFGK